MTVFQAIKDFFKCFLPPPTRAFNREVERILAAVGHSQQHVAVLESKVATLEGQLVQQVATLEGQLTQQQKELEGLRQQMESDRVALLGHYDQFHTTLDRVENSLLQEFSPLGQNLMDAEQRLTQALAPLEHRLDLMAQQQTAAATSLVGISQQMEETASTQQAQQKEGQRALERVRRQAIDGTRRASESVWAQIFNNAISDSGWLHNKAFTPGRWAMGYPALYALYRILNESKPKRILELGMGQSTRMIGQYAAAMGDVEHFVVEHDQDWITFFCNDFELSAQSKIVALEREMVPYKEAEAVRVFKKFKEAFEGQKFDFICIDAPLGGDMKEYARIDVLSLLPDCLAEDFALMIDDCDRIGEHNTVLEIKDILEKHSIAYKFGKYAGEKDSVVICAKDLSFLTSM